jgi:hypothetical protein
VAEVDLLKKKQRFFKVRRRGPMGEEEVCSPLKGIIGRGPVDGKAEILGPLKGKQLKGFVPGES